VKDRLFIVHTSGLFHLSMTCAVVVNVAFAISALDTRSNFAVLIPCKPRANDDKLN